MARVRNDAQYEANRARIIREAAQQFRAKGFGATTLEDVAGAAGFTKAALYYYFPKKEDLLLEICEQTVIEALTVFDSLDPGEPVDVRLRRVVARHLELLVADLDAWYVFFQEIGIRKEPRARRIVRHQRAFSERLEALLAEGMDAGVFRRRDPHVLGLAVLGMLNSVHRWYRAEKLPVERIAAEFTDLIERGVLA